MCLPILRRIYSMRHLALVAWLSLFAMPAHAKTVEYTLNIAQQNVNITGQSVEKITVNGGIPAPTLQFTQGDDAVVTVVNTMDQPTSVHWHGLILPGAMDGVTGFNGYQAIAPHSTFTYRFAIVQSGTYWYHAHTNGQEQDGLYGAIIAAPNGGDAIAAQRDYVVLLSDFSHESSARILGNLKMSSDYYANARLTVGDFFKDAAARGTRTALQDAYDWGNMRMMRTDLADVTGYTFLTNGHTPAQNWTGIFTPQQKVRLRFINASAMSFFDVRIPGLKMQVVQADGQNIEPVAVDEFRFAPAETYDVIVTPPDAKAYTIAAEPIDRTGFALGTLAPVAGMRGDIVAQRPRARLTMADMNMDLMMQDNPDMEMTDDMMTSGWVNAGTPAGQKALAYADLRYSGTQADQREPQRTIEVRLGGNMERYIWTINGKKFDDAEPIHLKYGERVRLKFINETMMAHPMHLHGMFVQLENGQPAAKLPNKHTVIVPPGDSYSVLLTADQVGEWAFHCHLLYHMASGMMRQVVVAKLDPADMPPAAPMHNHANAHGGDTFHMFTLQSDMSQHTQHLDLDGWIGTDDHKLWLMAEAERRNNSLEQSSVWALYSRNIATFWDAQAGIRYDSKPKSTTYAVFGVNGLAAQWIETQAHVFISERGAVTARLHRTHDLLLMQQLIVQPYAELNLAAQDVAEQQLGAGLTDGQVGVQLRYDITKKFSPYIDVRYSQQFGETAAMAHGDATHELTGSIGLRVMF